MAKSVKIGLQVKACMNHSVKGRCSTERAVTRAIPQDVALAISGIRTLGAHSLLKAAQNLAEVVE